MNNITVLKIGGSIITDRSSPTPKALVREIKRAAEEIAGTSDNLILVHGAGSFGHQLADKYHLIERFDTKGLIKTHSCVKILNTMVVDALVSAGVFAVPIHPFSCFLLDNGRIKEMFTSHIKTMLERKLVPVLHGDVVMDATRGISILSGDQIIAYIARRLGAGRIGVGSNTDGVLDAQGKMISLITPGTFHEIQGYISGSSQTDVTGGMLGKVQELVYLAETSGIESKIFNAAAAGNIKKFLKGTSTGTLIQKNK